MKYALLIASLLAAACAGVETGPRLYEADYVRAWCTSGKIEARLSDGTRVDCLTDTHAIEFDWASGWYAGVGQALHYAEVSGRKPGMVLILRPGRAGDLRNVERARKVAEKNGIKLWVVEGY